MDKFELLKRNAEEIVTEEELKRVLRKKKKVAYVGYAPTGRIHVGYFVPLSKVVDFLDAGFKFKILIADIHAHLDDRKTPWEELDERSEYYEKTIRKIIRVLGGKVSDLKFVRGSSYQFDREYIEDVLRMTTMVTVDRSRRAASEVVRFGKNPKLSGFLYPVLQIADVVHLGADVALGGIDQRGIYMLGRELLPELGYEKYVSVFTPLIPGLSGGKMSASVESSKISVHDSDEEIKRKIRNAYCPAKVVEGNPILAYAKYIIFPFLERNGKEFVVERPEKFGGRVEYSSYAELEGDYIKGKLHPLDLKNAVGSYFIDLISKIRA